MLGFFYSSSGLSVRYLVRVVRAGLFSNNSTNDRVNEYSPHEVSIPEGQKFRSTTGGADARGGELQVNFTNSSFSCRQAPLIATGQGRACEQSMSPVCLWKRCYAKTLQ
jgi:hypothetical protein